MKKSLSQYYLELVNSQLQPNQFEIQGTTIFSKNGDINPKELVMAMKKNGLTDEKIKEIFDIINSGQLTKNIDNTPDIMIIGGGQANVTPNS